MGYRVTAPYVTLKVRDHFGAWVLSGFHDGAVVSDVDPVSLRHHLDNGMVEEVGSPDPVDAEPVPPVDADQPPAPNGRPSVRAAKEDWVTYAVSQRGEGVSEDDARVEAENTSKADLIAKHGA